MIDEENYSDLEPEQCPDCGSKHTRTDSLFNWHKCEDCSAMWGFDENDPDYDEIPLENMAAANLEALEAYSLEQLENF